MQCRGTHPRIKPQKKERTSRRREPGYRAMREHFPSESWHMKEVRKNQRERHVRDLMRQGVSRFRAEWMLDNPQHVEGSA